MILRMRMVAPTPALPFTIDPSPGIKTDRRTLVAGFSAQPSSHTFPARAAGAAPILGPAVRARIAAGTAVVAAAGSRNAPVRPFHAMALPGLAPAVAARRIAVAAAPAAVG